jgi:hypothetical protein
LKVETFSAEAGQNEKETEGTEFIITLPV